MTVTMPPIVIALKGERELWTDVRASNFATEGIRNRWRRKKSSVWFLRRPKNITAALHNYIANDREVLELVNEAYSDINAFSRNRLSQCLQKVGFQVKFLKNYKGQLRNSRLKSLRKFCVEEVCLKSWRADVLGDTLKRVLGLSWIIFKGIRCFWKSWTCYS